jgi:hypothetical protein
MATLCTILRNSQALIFALVYCRKSLDLITKKLESITA